MPGLLLCHGPVVLQSDPRVLTVAVHHRPGLGKIGIGLPLAVHQGRHLVPAGGKARLDGGLLHHAVCQQIVNDLLPADGPSRLGIGILQIGHRFLGNDRILVHGCRALRQRPAAAEKPGEDRRSPHCHHRQDQQGGPYLLFHVHAPFY